VTGVVLVAPLLTDSGRWLPLDLIVNEVRIANVVPEAGMSANGQYQPSQTHGVSVFLS